ncbi:uncharacterized protein UMAG_00522 [Mycosarcoma maydis]|uniref:Uncharacterized protein n=1 Tax=Mycosarcoma maydis TaxID=5270 RepID=A0A0D1ED03_MYCMD|nr:uncharacterized protein UMAG_00522 [Ustilago maydis 521]KIS72100.1 hypothetical protein UMAG_00522 [Ustilago maydis 521]|eukprot:XP_011386362.1 hypothetical protein UMAG_00522 [Ustilago maydis 521]
MQHSFNSSTISLPASGEKKSKRNLLKRVSLKPKTPLSLPTFRNGTSLVSSSEERSPVCRTPNGCASMPTTPKSAKLFRTRSSSDARSLIFSTRSTSASIDAMRSSTNSNFIVKGDAPPVPSIPKSYLISDEVFVIASPPKVPENAPAPRTSSSSSSSQPSCYSMDSSTSLQSDHSWIGNMGFHSPSQENNISLSNNDLPYVTDDATQPARSSLDEIDDQIVLNLCLNLCHGSTPTGLPPNENGEITPSPHRRSFSSAAAPLFGSVTRHSHSRTPSAPVSLGPLPPQPSRPPTEAVLRKTDAIKKRYSKQTSSPLLSSQSNLPVVNSGSDAVSCCFSSPRIPTGMQKLDSISSLKSIEAGLSQDSKLAKRNHKRSASRQSIVPGKTIEQDFFTAPGRVKLTPGHIAATVPEEQFEEPQLQSRWSEDSNSGNGGVEEVRRLISSLILPKHGSSAKMASVVTSSPDSSTLSRRDVCLDGSKTPDMVSVRHSSSSSSSNSSISEHLDLNAVAPTVRPKAVEDEEETLFDLSRGSLDYGAVYALAQQYAQSHTTSVAPSSKPSLARPSALKTSKPTGNHKFSSLLTNTAASRSHRSLTVDPIDRSYHLRKF